MLKGLPADSIDALVTDPPYGLSFMGKKWDYQVPAKEMWVEALRVLKPGAHLLSFGGTRTYHRMVVNIEDAGFEVRDQIQWIFGQGFPKSLNIGLAIDKQSGTPNRGKAVLNISGNMTERDDRDYELKGVPYEPESNDAKKWRGFGTALKPANEPILLARKPISEKTVAANVLKWGTGGLNIDASRIGDGKDRTQGGPSGGGNTFNQLIGKTLERASGGRFPSNLILSHSPECEEDQCSMFCAVWMLDEQSGKSNSGGKRGGETRVDKVVIFGNDTGQQNHTTYGDKGGASRFFYCAKVSPGERGKENKHPTVKPLKLMRYLCRLVTPPGGTILDPFLGSGTTGLAAKQEGFQFIGIEKETDYLAIAQCRIGDEVISDRSIQTLGG